MMRGVEAVWQFINTVIIWAAVAMIVVAVLAIPILWILVILSEALAPLVPLAERWGERMERAGEWLGRAEERLERAEESRARRRDSNPGG